MSDALKLGKGKNFPEDFNVIIEIEANSSSPVKYEFDKDSGFLTVDRFIATPMYYPCNYGFVPNTLSDDGDPADVLVVTPFPIKAGSVIQARAVGVLVMEDEKGMDEKIIAVPVSGITKMYDNVKSIDDLDQGLVKKIQHFFEHYKDLEKGKWVKVQSMQGKEKAIEILRASAR
jgi:inorganic pyrophosphatase